MRSILYSHDDRGICMRVSIIGTAGRKDDGRKMSSDLYQKMIAKSTEIILENTMGCEHLDLISGGAAWSDHIAIEIFLNCPEKYREKVNLTLHLPAVFNMGQNKYDGEHWKSAGSISNYYHSMFSKKIGRDTLKDITKAFEKGAKIKYYKGFYARNKEVGKTDLLIAFTWGIGGVKDGGTKNTWNGSKATKKVHVKLRKL